LLTWYNIDIRAMLKSSVENHSVLFPTIENGELRVAVDFPPLCYGKSLNKLVAFS
jgi:hypothetical protein